MGDRILIKPKDKETKTAGGIYLPDEAASEVFVEGEVVEISDMEKCPVKKGDKVLYEGSAGTEIIINKEAHKLVQLRDIIAKIV